MSSLVVQVCIVDSVVPHANADRMEIARVKGWSTCVRKGQFQPGDKCVFVPPDTIVPGVLADSLGIANYLGSLPLDADGNRPAGGRVRVARLRGVPSYGLVLECADPSWPGGSDASAHFGFTKWEPPEPSADGDAERPHPAFHAYTEIENYRNFPERIAPGEEVVFTEKLHGKNTRVGLIRAPGLDGVEQFQFMAGSHGIRRKEYVTFRKVVKDPGTNQPLLGPDGEPVVREEVRRSDFWKIITDSMRALLEEASAGTRNVVLFGEMIGRGVQDIWYGQDEISFRAFDMALDGRYLDFDEKRRLFEKHGVPAVPVLYRGPFSREKVEEFVEGPTTVCPLDKAGKFKGREGIVITPARERFDGERVILKAIAFSYLERKGGTEFH